MKLTSSVPSIYKHRAFWSGCFSVHLMEGKTFRGKTRCFTHVTAEMFRNDAAGRDFANSSKYGYIRAYVRVIHSQRPGLQALHCPTCSMHSAHYSTPQSQFVQVS